MTSQGYDTATGGSGDRLGQAAGDLIDQAGQTAEAQVSTVMMKAGDTLSQVAQAVRQSGEGMREQQPMIADVADTAAQRVEDVSTYLRQHDAREVLQTAEDFARRQPAVVLAGGLALGLAIGRFLKSAQPSGGGSFRSGAQQGFGGYGSTDYGSTGYGSTGYGTAGYGTTGGAGAAGYGVAGAAGMAGGSAIRGGDLGAFPDAGEDTGTTNAYGTEAGAYEPDTLYDTDRVAAIGGYGTETGYDTDITGEGAGTETTGIRSTGTTETTDLENDRGA